METYFQTLVQELVKKGAGIVIGAGNRRCGGVRELRSRHYRNLFRICAVAPAPVPGAVAAMLLLPIPVALPPNKKNPALRPDLFLWWRCRESNPGP